MDDKTFTDADLERAALELPPEDRARLADHLLDSLTPSSPCLIAGAWLQEVARRPQEVQADKVTTVPGEQVSAKALNILRR